MMRPIRWFIPLTLAMFAHDATRGAERRPRVIVQGDAEMLAKGKEVLAVICISDTHHN